MNFNHLPLTTEDGTQLNLDALYTIAPSCFTEARAEKTGALRHAVAFPKLRQLLGDNAVEDEPESYEFTWVGKNAARREAATPINKTLRPVPESSVDWDHTQNIYIEGDNLDALKLLQKSYLGKIKMIYIDPPYNTGKDFVYHDNFKLGQDVFNQQAGNVDENGNRYIRNTDSNGRFHSDWCSMIYSRLIIAHSLLSQDGAIFISMDDNEIGNLRKICDEIFGETNFIACFTWKRRSGANDAKNNVSMDHEYVLCYGNSSSLKLNGVVKDFENYTNPDNDPRGPWAKDNLTCGKTASQRPNLYYPITDPTTGKVYPCNPDHVWRFEKSKMKELILSGKVIFPTKENGLPTYKRHLSEIRSETKPYSSIIETKLNSAATKELRQLLENQVFDYPKTVDLLYQLIQQASNKESIILDFFSGSSTLAHAVMQLNADDGGHRKFIMVQLPEITDKDSVAYKAGYKNICEIGEERIRRAGKKIKEDLKAKQPDLFTNDNDDKQPLDTGFRVFRIDSSNMKDVYVAPKDLKPQELDLFADNVKEGRTELDLLYGCMVDWGVQLSLPLSTETIDGVTVYTVNDGDLVACFGNPITENVVKAMADKAPLRVLFRDSCFEKDEQKINIFEQFKQLLGWSDDEALNNIRVI